MNVYKIPGKSRNDFSFFNHVAVFEDADVRCLFLALFTPY